MSANTSDLLNIPVPSPTVMVAVVAGVTTTNYTPAKNVEMRISGVTAGTASVTINGVAILNGTPANGMIDIGFFAAGGQALTIVTANAATGVVISARSIQ